MRNVLEPKNASQPKEDGGLKEMLEDFLLVAQHLAPWCDSIEHMLQIAKGAVEDNAQLQFLANVLKRSAKK